MANRGGDVRLLIAGLGLIGARHMAHALESPGISLVGCVDPTVRQDNVPHFDRLEDVDVEADAVLIATPTHHHLEQAEVAAARGWHMLIEKPVAHTVEAAKRIADLAERAGVQTLIGHHRRHHAAVVRLKDMIEAGVIGAPVLASMIWAMKKPDNYFAGNWRQGAEGSPVMINLVHEVDLLRHLFGEVVAVHGLGSNAQRGAARAESGAVGLMFETGLAATIAFSDAALSPWGFEAGTGENPNIGTTGQDYLQISGTAGSISFPSLTVWSGALDWSEPVQPNYQTPPKNAPLVAQLEHFAEVVAGRAKPLVGAADGTESLRVTLAIEAAVAPRKEVAA